MNSIYCFTNLINNKKYIGSTIQSPNVRYSQHIYNATHENTHQYYYPLYQAFRKYGLNNFLFEIIEQIECSESEIREREKYYILKYNTLSPNGYNQTDDTQHPINAIESYLKAGATKREKHHSVAEINSNNEILNIWRSATDCSEEIHISEKLISACCRGEQKTTNGRIFVWLDENNLPIIPIYNTNVNKRYKGEQGTTQQQSSNRKIAKYDLETNEIIGVYNSIALAARENNCDSSCISKVCKKIRKKCNGYGWKYIDKQEDI